ncbi:replication-relaxation family protein [Catelliglobosispora koreensis]|uniref:replication-relaxation family protein n=1 Tax=Catelliglobosispora koreensis TaxID=129052 RepID=UPI000381A881|nr:replication-relaxation family protein [Catelliglobosispora koreensis]
MTLANDKLMRLQATITPRDERLLGWLYDHGVLTTDQIAKALFPSKDYAQRRLPRLMKRGAVARFRPQRWEGGSYPYHYVLDQLGYEHVMGQRGLGMPTRDKAKRRKQSLISRRDLPHLLGANQLFIDLAAYERTNPGVSLARWWPATAFHGADAFYREGSDSRLGMRPNGYPRPDGHGVWVEGNLAVPFFAEYDTGTEPHSVLGDKVDKYELLYRESVVWQWPVLFVFSSWQRELNFHEHLADRTRRLWTTFATAATDSPQYLDQTPAGAVWHVGGRPSMRRRLIDLPYIDPEHDIEWAHRLGVQ